MTTPRRRGYGWGNDPNTGNRRFFLVILGAVGVAQTGGNLSIWTAAANRLAARRAAFTRPAMGFVSQPEPRMIGHFGRGKQLIAGNFQFAGHLIEAPDSGLWDLVPPDAAFASALQGFAWLDDLAAVGDADARRHAQDWTWGWIARFGRGRGPGWTPDLTGRRLIRCIHHALLLLQGRNRAQSEAFYAALSAQTVFLSRRWQTASPGLPRFEALCGLIYSGLALTGMERRMLPAVQALARECRSEVNSGGGIASRNPEDLLEVFTLLTWAAQALGEAGHQVPPNHLAALERIAPALRALRHADGGLARFHGGDRGLDGRLDMALAASGVKALPQTGFPMGFARLSGGRTSVIVDVAQPPGGRAGASAHASTLAFELTSGRRPLVVSCGSGAPFGADWHRVGRATASHSTLSVAGFSSSRFGPGADAGEVLENRAEVTLAKPVHYPQSHGLQLAHAGWVRTHGLTYSRELVLSQDGRELNGQDDLTSISAPDRARLAEMQARTPEGALTYALRFHLHPDVEADLDLGGTAVSLLLKSGEVWVFRHNPGPNLTLEPSVYLEQGRLKPRASRQIVLSGRIEESDVQIGWTLAKAQDTPLAIRDMGTD